MAQRINLPRQAIPPGFYSHEIIAPTRSSAARVTLTRAPGGWPAGELFTYRAFERERNSEALSQLGRLRRLMRATFWWGRQVSSVVIRHSINLLTSGMESGGPAVGKDGTVNPPLVITLRWPVDKDRDLIRFELDVVQTFTTAITVEFL